MGMIEKRYGCENCPLAQISCEGCDSYNKVIGATEQKAIDIEKACEIYENELREIVRIVNMLRKGVGDCISIEGCVKDFRKAMEE